MSSDMNGEGAHYDPQPRMKTIEPYASARSSLAGDYRKMRRQNPAMARLLFRRVQIAQRKIIKDFWGL